MTKTVTEDDNGVMITALEFWFWVSGGGEDLPPVCGESSPPDGVGVGCAGGGVVDDVAGDGDEVGGVETGELAGEFEDGDGENADGGCTGELLGDLAGGNTDGENGDGAETGSLAGDLDAGDGDIAGELDGAVVGVSHDDGDGDTDGEKGDGGETSEPDGDLDAGVGAVAGEVAGAIVGLSDDGDGVVTGG